MKTFAHLLSRFCTMYNLKFAIYFAVFSVFFCYLEYFLFLAVLYARCFSWYLSHIVTVSSHYFSSVSFAPSLYYSHVRFVSRSFFLNHNFSNFFFHSFLHSASHELQLFIGWTVVKLKCIRMCKNKNLWPINVSVNRAETKIRQSFFVFTNEQ